MAGLHTIRTTIAGVLSRLPRTRLALPPDHLFALVVALVASFCFFLPTLASLRSDSSGWPSFMLTGDIRMAWFPQFVQSYHRFWKGGIFGMDFLTHGGASSFGFRANMLPIYPPYLLSFLVFDISKIRTAGMVFAGLHVLHIFAAAYFCVLLGRRFLALSLGGCVLFAFLYAISFQTAAYVAFTPWLFQIALVPVVAYVLCTLIYARTWVAPVLASAVVVTYALTNYAPTMLAGLAIAVAIALFVFHSRLGLGNWRAFPRRALVFPIAALLLGLVVVLPYYAAQLDYFSLTVAAGAPKSLKAIAHDDTLSPTSVITGLSQYMMGAPAVEGRFHWGLVPFLILVAGLAHAAAAPPAQTTHSRSVFAFTLPIHLGLMLITFGVGTILADAFYYGVPVLGTMHIYQRYLMFGQILIALAAATSADMFVSQATPRARVVMFTAGFVIWLGSSLALVWFTDAYKLVVVERILPELLLAFAAATALAIGRGPLAVAGLALLMLPANLVPVFDMQRTYGQKAIWSQMMNYEPATMSALASTLQVGGKVLPKVLNLTDDVDSFLPHNQSWLVPGRLRYMNFTGYEPHLAMDRAYFDMMGGWYGRFNREWVLRTGVDFAVWTEATRWKLDQLAVDTVSLGPTTALRPGLFLTRLIYRDAPRIGQDASLLSYLVTNQPTWRPFAMDGWKVETGHFVKTPGTHNHIGILLRQRPGTVYDISVDVVRSSKGSVTLAFGSAASPPISGAEPGRHTRRFTVDGSGDLWITGTPDFDGALTNLVVREARDNLPARLDPVFDNGVVRVEGAAGQVDIRRASTDYSQNVRVDLSSKEATRVVYLLWANRYMVPYLDGQRARWTQIGNWPAFVEVPPGDHRLEFRFRSAWTRILFISFGLWTVLFLAAIGYWVWQSSRRPDTA